MRPSISADLTGCFLFLSSQQQRDNDSVSGESGDEFDPFNDPDDKWEKDFKLDSPSNRFAIHMLFSFVQGSNLIFELNSQMASTCSGFTSHKRVSTSLGTSVQHKI